MKKPKMTTEQHLKLGEELHTLRTRLHELIYVLQPHYPLAIQGLPLKACKAIDLLRCHLDNDCEVYYPSL